MTARSVIVVAVTAAAGTRAVNRGEGGGHYESLLIENHQLKILLSPS